MMYLEMAMLVFVLVSIVTFRWLWNQCIVAHASNPQVVNSDFAGRIEIVEVTCLTLLPGKNGAVLRKVAHQNYPPFDERYHLQYLPYIVVYPVALPSIVVCAAIGGFLRGYRIAKERRAR